MKISVRIFYSEVFCGYNIFATWRFVGLVKNNNLLASDFAVVTQSSNPYDHLH